MRGERRCGACGRAERRDGVERVSVALPRCGVVASVEAPARRCPECGDALVDGAVLARAHLAVGCELADQGVHTGDALRHMRKALGLRAADLARLLDVTPETVSHWETGKVLPSRSAFVAVAAMVEEALDGRAVTRRRLEVLAEGRPWPRALEVRLPARRAARGRRPQIRHVRDARHELAEHTGELAIRLEAPGVEELFTEAGRALAEALGPRPAGEPTWRERVSLEARDREALLVDWLNELVFLAEARKVAFTGFEIERMGERPRLEATVRGVPGARPSGLVKAATFHGLRVVERDGVWSATVILDV